MAVHLVEGRPVFKLLLDDHTTHSHAEHGADITLVVELVGRQSPESLSSSRPTYCSKHHVQVYLSCTVVLRQAVGVRCQAVSSGSSQCTSATQG